MSNKPKIDNSVTQIRSNQNLSCNWTGSADFGRIVPFHIQELIPTDKVVRCRPNIELQMLSLASPTFGKMDLYVHYFFVPTRLLWANFMPFYTQSGSGRSVAPPTARASEFSSFYGSASADIKRAIYKHWTSIGLPPFFTLAAANLPSTLSNKSISLLPFRAYQQIWWDFYRDPELISEDSKSFYLSDSGGLHSLASLEQTMIPRRRAITNNWLADLFAQAGNSVTSSVGTANGVSRPLGSATYQYPATSSSSIQSESLDSPIGIANITGSGAYSVAATSRQLRLIETLTRLSERMSLSGKRQIDAFMSRYGVRPNWLKMQMSQYLGGAKSTVLISDITSSADTSVIDTEQGMPLGAKAASGYSRFNNLNIEFEAHEPGYLVGVFSVMPHIHFVQGLDKMFIKNDLSDWFQSSLEHVGNVAVARSEVALPRSGHSVSGNLDESFAFRDPYYEYKVGRDILAGDFMYYFDNSSSTPDGTIEPSIQYMQSMAQYIDFPSDIGYNAENMSVDSAEFNKIFYYQGGNLWDDTDDHFHLCIDKDILINRPMDGFAIPTLETTETPHVGKDVLPTSTTL